MEKLHEFVNIHRMFNLDWVFRNKGDMLNYTPITNQIIDEKKTSKLEEPKNSYATSATKEEIEKLKTEIKVLKDLLFITIEKYGQFTQTVNTKLNSRE